MLVMTKGHTYLNKPGSLGRGFALRMHDLLLPAGIKGLKNVLKSFRKFLENHFNRVYIERS